jgi:hypothetical protein
VIGCIPLKIIHWHSKEESDWDKHIVAEEYEKHYEDANVLPTI